MEIFKKFYADEDYFNLCANFSEVSLDQKMEQFDQNEFWEERFSHGKRLYDHYLEGRLGSDDLVFDFGCGDGAWLGGLREVSGCRVDGEEISPIYADVVRKKLGANIFLGPIEETADDIAEKYRGQVRLAIVSGSLQHMLDPMKCLRVAREILTDDGELYICNWSTIEHYMQSYEGSFHRLIGEIVSWEHLHYFHETSFRYLLGRAGFEVRRFALNSEIRLRHMDALAVPTDKPAGLPAPAEVTHVLDRIRAHESATVAGRLRLR
jgi:SAM-dependent methyltransferase